MPNIYSIGILKKKKTVEKKQILLYNKIDMKKQKIYLDTSIINFALEDEISINERDVTQVLCEQIKQGKYEAFVSDVVIQELINTPDEIKRTKLLDCVNSLVLDKPLTLTDEINILADRYVSEKIIPAKHKDDALHIAICTVNDIDVLVSWNFEHLVKHKTRMEVFGINMLLGYKLIDLCTPQEVIEDV